MIRSDPTLSHSLGGGNGMVCCNGATSLPQLNSTRRPLFPLTHDPYSPRLRKPSISNCQIVKSLMFCSRNTSGHVGSEVRMNTRSIQRVPLVLLCPIPSYIHTTLHSILGDDTNADYQRCTPFFLASVLPYLAQRSLSPFPTSNPLQRRLSM